MFKKWRDKIDAIRPDIIQLKQLQTLSWNLKIMYTHLYRAFTFLMIILRRHIAEWWFQTGIQQSNTVDNWQYFKYLDEDSLSFSLLSPPLRSLLCTGNKSWILVCSFCMVFNASYMLCSYIMDKWEHSQKWRAEWKSKFLGLARAFGYCIIKLYKSQADY